MATRVGIRELRQNLSVYLRRVAEGEDFVVTEHREPVARLTPLDAPQEDLFDRLVREGKITPPKHDLLDVPLPPPPPPGTPSVQEMIDDLREERLP